MDRGKRELDLGCQRHSDLLRLSGYSRHQKRHSTRAATARHKPSPHRNAAFAGLDNGLDDRTRKDRLLEYGIAPPGPCGRLSRGFPRASVKAQHSNTPLLHHSIRKKSSKLVRRSPSSMLPTARSRPRKRGALHNRRLARTEAQPRSPW